MRSSLVLSVGAAVVVAASVLAVTLHGSGGHPEHSTLAVVGTSDVYDSDLVQKVLKPGFEKAFPQYTLSYVSKGSGAAITYAEAGTASALIVHAASLENQFVAAGYSAEPFGRAVFYGDYVLLGPPSDPAGVLTSAPHDIVGAFQRIAAAGAVGKANFVSRGGTPGTTVQEHAIWKLARGTQLCRVSAADGGGFTPSTMTGTCPSEVTAPSWYHVTGLTQAPNIQNADVCNYAGGNCYVLTDRGTFEYLESVKSISALEIVTRDNAPAAPGGSTLLTNSFHAYAVNPAKFPPGVAAHVNRPAAIAFLDWLTSAAGQKAVGSYLDGTGDSPFRPDAAPILSLRNPTVPLSLVAGKSLTISGYLRNAVPDAPPLGGRIVTLRAAEPVATGRTDPSGDFTIRFTPVAGATYSLATGPITEIENTQLSPVFGDQLQPTSVLLGNSAS